MEADAERRRPLQPMEKCRIRKRFPFPNTIWDGVDIVHRIRVSDRICLEESFTRNKYPDEVEKRALVEKTELSLTQVNDWFKNHRLREKRQSNAATRRTEV